MPNAICRAYQTCKLLFIICCGGKTPDLQSNIPNSKALSITASNFLFFVRKLFGVFLASLIAILWPK